MSNEIKRNYRHKLNLQLFAEPPADPQDPQDPPADPPAPKKLELTQEEFDAKIAERLARQAKKFADYDDLKTKLSEFEKAEEERKKAAMTEKERLEAEKAEALKRADDAVAEREKALQSANQRLIRAEFRLLAKEAGVRPEALDDAYVLADLTAVKVDDDGSVQGVKDVLDALIAAKPYLAEQPKREPRQIGSGSGADPKPEKTKEQLLAEAADKARRTGKIEDMMAYSRLKQELEK